MCRGAHAWTTRTQMRSGLNHLPPITCHVHQSNATVAENLTVRGAPRASEPAVTDDQ